MRLTHLFNEGSNWHTDPEQQSMDATRRARLGREREPAGSDAIDARLAANNNARQQYAETGRFWLKQKDNQQHLNDQPYIGKAAANAAALGLLKQQPELRGNLVITAYGPGEQQVTEGKVKELGQDLKDKGMSDTDFKKKYSKTRAEVRAAMREKPVSEGIPDVDHMHGPRGINLPSADTRDLLQKTFEIYGNYKEWYRDVNRVNSELLDDNAEFSTMSGGKIISINGKDFAFWSNRNGNGSIDINIAKKHSGQGVAEGSSESVSLRDMVNVVDQHYPKYYAELSGSDISDKQFERAIVNAYKKIMQKQGVAEAPGAETLGHNQSTVASNLNSLDLGEGSDQQVGFSLDSERAYQAVMTRFGDMIDQDQDSGVMYAPERLWPKIEQVAYDADGIGAQRDDDLENPEHYGMKEGEKVGNMDADRFDDAMARLKKLAGAGPMRTVYDPAKRVYKNVPTAQQPKK